MAVELTTLRRYEAALDSSRFEQGARAVERSSEAMGRATTAAGNAIEQTDRKVVQSSTNLDRLRRSIDPTFAAQQRLERGTRTLNSALERGQIDAAEHARLIALLQQRYDASAASAQRAAGANQNVNRSIIDGMSAAGRAAVPFRDYNAELVRGMSVAGQAAAANDKLSTSTVTFGRSTGLASWQVLQLSQQIQDLGVQIASGQNPFVAIAQQGSQAAFIMGGFAASLQVARNAVQALTATMRANPLLSAATVVTAGIAAVVAGLYAFRDATEEAEAAQDTLNQSLETAIRRHEQLGRQIELTAKARAAEARAAVELQQQEIRRRQEALDEERERVEEIIRSRFEAAAIPGAPEPDPAIIRQSVEMAESVKAAREEVEAAERELTFLNARLGVYDDLATRSATASALLGNTVQDLGNETADAARKTRSFADVLADLNEQADRNRARDYAAAIALIERTVESGLTDQQRYERQVRELNAALELAASRGYRLSTEAQEALNRALRDADLATQAAIEASQKLERERQRQAEQAAREMQRPFDHAAENIQDAFAATYRDIFRRGIDSFGDLAARIRDIFINLAAEIAALMTIRPVLAGVTSGLGSFLTGTGASAAGSAAGSGLAAGGVLSGIGSSINTFGASLGFASSTGVSVAAAGPGAVGPHVVGSVPGAAQTGFFGSGATLLGTLGAGGLGFIGGGLLASLTGGNQLGGALGGGLGAGIGFAVGGPVGGILGGLAGSVLGGLLGGGKKPSAQLLTAPDRFADFQSGLFRETPFGFVGFSASGTRKIDDDALRQMLEAVAGFDVAAAGTLREGEIQRVARILQETEALREKSRRFDERDFQELVDDRIRTVFRALGLGADVAAQATAGVDPAASLERALATLTDRQTILGLGEAAEEINVFAEAMTALEDRFAELGRRAVELGLDTGNVVTGFEKAAEALRRELLAPIDAFLASLETSALAPGTPLDRLGAAREQFADIVARARAGDAAAIAALPGAGQQVLTLGRQVFASTTDFAQLFEQVRSAVQSIREAPALAEIDNTAVVEAIREAERARREEARRAEQQREELRREMTLLRQELRAGSGPFGREDRRSR